jgi:hypothetical protein
MRRRSGAVCPRRSGGALRSIGGSATLACVDDILTYRGRRITTADLTGLRDRIAAQPGLSRRALSLAVCDAWQWRQPNGTPCDAICRGLLLWLHRGGHLVLPPPKWGTRKPWRPRTSAPPVLIDTTPITGPLRALRPLARATARVTGQGSSSVNTPAQYGIVEALKHAPFVLDGVEVGDLVQGQPHITPGSGHGYFAVGGEYLARALEKAGVLRSDPAHDADIGVEGNRPTVLEVVVYRDAPHHVGPAYVYRPPDGLVQDGRGYPAVQAPRVALMQFAGAEQRHQLFFGGLEKARLDANVVLESAHETQF